MKIEMNTIYHLPTQELENDFLRQADEQEITWDYGQRATTIKQLERYKKDYCIRVEDGRLGGFSEKSWYETTSSLPIIEWKLGFTKADMQIGQVYKLRNGVKLDWEKSDIDYYTDDLKCKDGSPQYDIIEIYPLNLTPIWKRPEPKYRVKTELTKEQAEKLGLEFCEEAEDERH